MVMIFTQLEHQEEISTHWGVQKETESEKSWTQKEKQEKVENSEEWEIQECKKN